MPNLDTLMFNISKWNLPTYDEKVIIDPLSDEKKYTWVVRNNGFYTKHFATRLAAFGCIPLEALAALQNLIKLPFQPIGAFLKYPIKMINAVLHIDALDKLDRRLSGISDIFETAKKVIGYTLGTFLTATYGIYDPAANVHIHKRFGLYTPIASVRQKKANEAVEKFKYDMKIYGVALPAGKRGGIFAVDQSARKNCLDAAAEERMLILRLKWNISKVLSEDCAKYKLKDLYELVQESKDYDTEELFNKMLNEYNEVLQKAIRSIKARLFEIAAKDPDENFREALNEFASSMNSLNAESYFEDIELIDEESTYNIEEIENSLNKKFGLFFKTEREKKIRKMRVQFERMLSKNEPLKEVPVDLNAPGKEREQTDEDEILKTEVPEQKPENEIVKEDPSEIDQTLPPVPQVAEGGGGCSIM